MKNETTGVEEFFVTPEVSEDTEDVVLMSDTEVLVDGVRITGGFVDGVSYDYTYPMEPVTVSEGCVFVMGDHRSTSVDSRNTAVGCVAEEQVVGKIIFRIWPFDVIGPLN